jgi:hypothetical protein
MSIAAARAHGWILERSGGRLLGRVGGRPVLLLTTTGRRSGRPRRTPVQYERIGGAAVARTADGEQRRRLWPELCARNPALARVQRRAGREIPVVILRLGEWAPFGP